MDGVFPDSMAAARPKSRSARRRQLSVSATLPLPTPGSKRSSGGADGAFPLISISKRAATSGGRRVGEAPSRNQPPTKCEVASRPPKWVSAPSNNAAGDERSAALRDRLHASGLKRSIVQAQLFPAMATPQEPLARPNNQEVAEAETGATRPQTMAAAITQATAHRPLDFAVRMQSTGLVPTRPMTSTALRRQWQAVCMPQSAREYVEPVVDRAKEPLSARDRFYVEQRASTAPSRSSSIRRRQVQLNVQSDPAAAPNVDLPPKDNNSESAVSKRLMLLEKRNSFRTFTEGLALHLSRMNQGGGAAGLERDSFLYLRRVGSNPYNLVVATHAEIDPQDYYTVSRLGITHFSDSSSEFVPLEKFEQEHYQYSVIVTVRRRSPSITSLRMSVEQICSSTLVCASSRSSRSTGAGRRSRAGDTLSRGGSARRRSRC